MIEITKATFEEEVLKAKEPVLLDFSGAKICKCNVDENPDLAGEFDVQSIPTLLVFKNGEVVNRAVGTRDEASLKAMLGI